MDSSARQNKTAGQDSSWSVVSWCVDSLVVVVLAMEGGKVGGGQQQVVVA